MLSLLTMLFLAQLDLDSGRVWPAFRGNGTSLTSAKNLPLNWSDEQNIAWNVKLVGYGQSSPVVYNGKVFVTAISGPKQEKLHLLCLDLASGKTLWQRDYDSAQPVPTSDYVSRAAPTPVVDAQRVIAAWESGNIIAHDHSGKMLWQRNLVEEYGPMTQRHGLGGSLGYHPAVDANTVVFTVPNMEKEKSYLLALDMTTGKNRWKITHPFGTCWSTPVVTKLDGQPAVLVSSVGSVCAFTLADGKLLWEQGGITGNASTTPTIAGRLVLIGSGDKSGAGALFALKLDAKAGEDRKAWTSDRASSTFGSPLAHAGNAYTVSRAGVVYCVDLASGKTNYDERIKSSCWASPIGWGERVYFFGVDGLTTVLKAGPTFEKLAENRLTLKNRVYGVAAVDGAFLIRTGTQLICVGRPE